MLSQNDPARAALQSTQAALLEKIEELSFLRSLNDRLARVADFASACRALVDLVWEERHADAVAYVSIDVERRVCCLEAVAPAEVGREASGEFGFDTPPFPAFLDQPDLVVLRDAPLPAWLAAATGVGTDGGVPVCGGTLIGAPMRVRGATTGVLVVYARGDTTQVEEDRRLLAIVATSAALALDVARSEAREEFLAMLRHDINTPVAAALGYTELLVERLQADSNDDLLRLAASVLESLKAVADLVSNYLHMAAIDRGVHCLHLQEVDLGALTADIVERLHPSAVEKQITIECHGACPSVRADRRQLERVITNLVSNAIKYTPGPGRIDVTVSSDATGATLAVTDTGYGLTADDLERLFVKYGRFHRHKGIPGTGLGLFLSKAIVEAHGGTITVISEPDRGSTFTVRVPNRGSPSR
jgi:signal transduction histidine kinase